MPDGEGETALPDEAPASSDEDREALPQPPEQEDESPAEILARTPFPRPRPGALRNIVATIAVGLVIVGLVLFFDRPGGEGSSESVTLTAGASGPAPRIGEPAPEFEVLGLDGETFRLSDFRGQPVWINFWATWCPPCRAETPDMQAVYEANQDAGLVLIALSIAESADTVRDYVERVGVTYTIGLDQSTAISATYRIVGLPTHFFIDRDGIVRELRIGSMSRGTMEKKVEAIMLPSEPEESG
jgi:peroxiredoxin